MKKRSIIPPGDLVAVDTETTGLAVWKGDAPFAISFCNDQGQTGYFQFEVDPFTRKVHYLKHPGFIKELRRFLEDESISKVFHNASFDIRMFDRAMGIKVRGKIHDSLIAYHTCYSAADTYALKPLCVSLFGSLGYGKEDEEDLKSDVVRMRRKAKKLGWNIHEHVEADYWICKQLEEDNNKCEKYAIKDADRTMLLFQFAMQELEESNRMESYEFEMEKLWPLIYEMEGRGLAFYPGVADQEIRNCEDAKIKARKSLAKIANDPNFNPNSPRQVQRLLFEKLQLEATSWGTTTDKKTGIKYVDKSKPSSSSESLWKVVGEPAVKELMSWRSNDKGITSFFSVFKESAVEHDIDEGIFVIHPSIRQGGKRTGRLSVSAPNLQGLTDVEGGRGESDVPARKPFGPRPGYKWLLGDYNQLEVRTFTATSQYSLLIDILNSGRDLHTEATNGIWGKGERAIKAALAVNNWEDTPRKRREVKEWLNQWRLGDEHWDIVQAEASFGKKTSRNKGKPFFFTRMFGGGANSISHKLHISVQEAKELVRDYDRAMPGVIQHVRKMGKYGKIDKYTMTLYGRALDLYPGEENKACPYIVQGTAADLVKRAMLACDAQLKEWAKDDPGMVSDGGIILQIHDELIFELPESFPDQKIRMLQRIMEAQGDEIVDGEMDDLGRPMKLSFPVKFKQVRYGGNWAEPEPWPTQGV